MTKKYALLLGLILTVGLGPLAGLCQESSYQGQLNRIAELAQGISGISGSGLLSFSSYDKWLKEVKAVGDAFIQEFGQAYGKRESFQAIGEGLNQLNLIWNALKQVEYAEAEYKESITAGDVSYAHKWKNSAIEQRKKALELVPAAIDCFLRAKKALASGN